MHPRHFSGQRERFPDVSHALLTHTSHLHFSTSPRAMLSNSSLEGGDLFTGEHWLQYWRDWFAWFAKAIISINSNPIRRTILSNSPPRASLRVILPNGRTFTVFGRQKSSCWDYQHAAGTGVGFILVGVNPQLPVP